jgi:hypothetical protein
MTLRNRRIIGGPGSGKSSLIAKELAQLCNHTNTLHPCNLLCLTFNVAANQSFQQKLREHRVMGADVRTLHSLARHIYTTFTGKPTQSRTVIRAAAACAIENASSEKTGKFPYQLIFVDEAQDLTLPDVVILKHLLNITQAKIWLAGDVSQAINQFQCSDSKYFQQWDVDDVTVLDKSHRCTPEILQVVNALRIEAPMTSHKPDGGKIPVLFCGDTNAIKEYLRSHLVSLEKGIRIGIVGPARKPSKLNVGLLTVEMWLREWALPYKKHFKFDRHGDSAKKHNNNNDAFVCDTYEIQLHTIHSSKGLTFDVCFVLDFHEYATGKISSEEKEMQMKNLFHVGTSRAASELYIFCRQQAQVFKDIRKCFQSIELPGFRVPKPPAREVPHHSPYDDITAWTTYLETSTVATEEVQLDLTNAWDIHWDILQEPTFPNQANILEQGDGDLPPVLGIFAENAVEYLYTNKPPQCIRNIQRMIADAIDLPPSLSIERLGNIWTESAFHMVWSDVLIKKLESLDMITDEVDTLLKSLPQDKTLLHVHDPSIITQFFQKFVLEELVNKTSFDAMDIWKASLFLYQYENHAIVLWQKYCNLDESTSLALTNIYENLTQMALDLPEGVVFQHPVSWPRLRLRGVVDIYHPSTHTIIELKYTSSRIQNHLGYALQVLGYRDMIGRRHVSRYTTEVWNLCTMEKCRILGTTCKRRRWDIERILLRSLRRQLDKPIWCYDLETQGLLSQEHSGIVEIHMEDYETGVCPLSTLVYQDMMPFHASKVNGIFQEHLVGKPTVEQVAFQVRSLLEQFCKTPVFMAYNGSGFDHQIVKRDLLVSSEENIRWQDPMWMIYYACPEKPPNRKLATMYQHVLGHAFKGTIHRAEADVVMMIEIMEKLAITPAAVRQKEWFE